MSKATVSEKIRFINETLDKIKDICIEGIKEGKDSDMHPWEVIQLTTGLVYQQDLALSILLNNELMKGKTKEQIADEIADKLDGKSNEDLIDEAIKALKDPNLQEHLSKTEKDNVVEFKKKKEDTFH